jgi:hypothetical protein
MRARLDAPDHAVGLLQAGDHDHRDVVQPLIGLEPFEHLEAIQLGHQEIEQNEVELLDRENLQRPAARFRSGHLVTVVAEAAVQQIAVAGVVVDHQNSPGLLRRPVARLDRFDRSHQIGDHAGDGTLVLAGKLGAVLAAGEIDDRVDPRQKARGFAEQRLEIGTDRGAAELIQLLQQEFSVAFNRVQRIAQIVPHPGLDRTEIGARRLSGRRCFVEQAVDYPEQLLRGGQDPLEIGREVDQLQPLGFLHQQLAVADQRRDRRQQLLAHVGEARPTLAVGIGGRFGHGSHRSGTAGPSHDAPAPSRRSIFSSSRASSTGLVS